MVVDRGISHTREGLLISKFRPKIIYLLRNRKAGKDRAASLGEESLNNPRKYRLLHLSHSVHFVGPTLYSIRHFGNLFAHRLHEWSYKIKIDNILFAPFFGKSQCLFTYACALIQDEDIYTILFTLLWGRITVSALTRMVPQNTEYFIYPISGKSHMHDGRRYKTLYLPSFRKVLNTWSHKIQNILFTLFQENYTCMVPQDAASLRSPSILWEKKSQ